MKSFLWDIALMAIGAGLAYALVGLTLNGMVFLPKDEWRCVRYLPGSAECAVYERVNL